MIVRSRSVRGVLGGHVDGAFSSRAVFFVSVTRAPRAVFFTEGTPMRGAARGPCSLAPSKAYLAIVIVMLKTAPKIGPLRFGERIRNSASEKPAFDGR